MVALELFEQASSVLQQALLVHTAKHAGALELAFCRADQEGEESAETQHHWLNRFRLAPDMVQDM